MHHERDGNSAKNIGKEGKRILRKEKHVTIITSSTVGTTGSHAPGDRVRRVNKTAVARVIECVLGKFFAYFFKGCGISHKGSN